MKENLQTVWRGPHEDGITQSLLSRFLMCRERFRVLVIEGLAPMEQFNHRLEYGNFWHICEEHSSGGGNWTAPVTAYAKQLALRFPESREQIEHWWRVCLRQFEIYEDLKGPVRCNSLMQEFVFSVPYKLPSGRTVILRGKWDSVFGEDDGIWLLEHKTKGTVDEQTIRRQLTFDLQTMFYVVALKEHIRTNTRKEMKGKKVAGVLYNVVRRPLSGGKGSIRQHKATKNKPGETKEHFYDRVAKIIQEDSENYFFRWKVVLTKGDVAAFKRKFLRPILEQLCDWWHIQATLTPPLAWYNRSNYTHWQTPFEVWNVLEKGGTTDLDAYLTTGNRAGLHKVKTLFGELE